MQYLLIEMCTIAAKYSRDITGKQMLNDDLLSKFSTAILLFTLLWSNSSVHTVLFFHV